jgi:integrase
MPKRFTDRFISTLKPADNRFEKIEDGGLGIRVSPVNAAGRSSRSWFYSYRFHGVKRRLTLGHYPETSLKEARAGRDQAAAILDKGTDPANVKVGATTFGSVLDRYLESRKFASLAATTRVSYGRAFVKLPRLLRQIPVDKLVRRDLRDHLEQVAKKFPTTAVAYKTAFSAALTWAMREDLVDYNVARDVDLDITPNSRDRFLSEDEIRIFWTTLDKLPISEQIKDVLRFELVTGLRIGSICKIKPEYVVHREKLLRTPKKDVKRGSADLWTPLSPMAMDIIERGLATYASKEWLFASSKKPGAALYKNSVMRLFRVIREDGVLALNERTTSHDLRRTLATHLSRQEVEREYIKQILNHTIKDVTDIYIRADFIPQKRKYLNLWSEKLTGIINGGKGVDEKGGEAIL